MLAMLGYLPTCSECHLIALLPVGCCPAVSSASSATALGLGVVSVVGVLVSPVCWVGGGEGRGGEGSMCTSTKYLE